VRKLKVFLFLALVGRFLISLACRCVSAPRRLLTHSATDPEIHVIAAAAEAESTTTTPPPPRRRSARRITIRVLPASPRAWPQTT
jgi:hypothetical protein